MFFYEVAIGGRGQSPKGIFTYKSTERLKIGQLVYVRLRKSKKLGFIVKRSSKPSGYSVSTVDEPTNVYLPETTIATYTALTEYYPFSEQALAQLFTPSSIPTRSDPFAKVVVTHLDSLNQAQADVITKITTLSSRYSLLFGDTGTGKTRIYTHLASKTLAEGKSVLLLTPEIGLSSHIAEEIQKNYQNVILYHSSLSTKKKNAIWSELCFFSGPHFIIGPRSILGLPVKNIGLIILDEAHDNSYSQDSSPYMNARTTASILAAAHNARLVFGSATPLISDMYRSKNDGTAITLSEPALKHGSDSTIRVLDEKSIGVLSLNALELVASTLAKGKQAMVLLNRRGTARHVFCDLCGYEERCTHCSHLLSYHHDHHRLLCHYCNRRFSVPTVCSDCKNPTIKMTSSGTKALTEELGNRFPGAIIGRYDSDSKASEHLSLAVKNIREGKTDIIVGTQMIAKGLDLPLLGCLVIIAGASDGSFSGEERSFQLLYQAIGRSLRGHQTTHTVIQTTTASASGVKAAVARDYMAFYTTELAERKKFNYPPFVYMLLIEFSSSTRVGAKKTGNILQQKIVAMQQPVTVIGPLPNENEKIGKTYNWHILLKAKKRTLLVNIAKELGANYHYHFDPTALP